LQDLKDTIVFYERGISDELLSVILPLEAGIKNMKKIYVKNSAVAAICHGADLAVPGVVKCDDGFSGFNFDNHQLCNIGNNCKSAVS